MRNKYTIFLIIIFALSLTCCTEKRSKFLIGVSQCSIDEWRDKMNMELENEAAISQKVDLIILSSNDNTEKQIADIKYLIEKGVDLLILTPNEIESLTSIIEEIYDRKIPVILVDRKINSDKFTAFIGADNYQIGRQVGHYVANLLEERGNIAQIKGLGGSSSAIERDRGFTDVIKEYPQMKIVFQGDGQWLKNEGAAQMRKALDSNAELDLVFVQNDRMAKGAYLEIEKEKRKKNIYLLGIDGLPGPGEGIDMVLHNKLEATFLYPTGGDKTIQLALDILEKREFDKENILATSVIDRKNAQILKLQTDQIVEQQNKVLVLNERVNNQWERYNFQRNIMYIVSLLALLFCMLLITIFRANHAKNRINKELNDRNLEVNKQKDELESKQEQLIAISKQLEEATNAKLVFFTDISHDFRTPLMLISGPVDILLSESNPDKEEYKWLNIIKKNVAVLLRLVNQIIEFRKIETNNTQLTLTSNDLDSCIAGWNLLFTQFAQKNMITFEYQKDEAWDYLFQFDLNKMERIYFNLLSNALKFTNKQGHVSVVLSKTAVKGMDFVQIAISNTGNGLSQYDIKNIFERFYRIDSHVVGSGIGLALVKALVELHNGHIEAVSSSTLTTFLVQIPMIATDVSCVIVEQKTTSQTLEFEDDLTEEMDQIDDLSTTTQPTLLVIDDNEEIRFYIRSILKNRYHIIEASDGEAGLSLAYENNIDLIISDIMMPKVDGLELCMRIKEDVKVCHIPVILLTACSVDEQRIKGFESGADAYISKPFDPQLFALRIRKMLENRQKMRAQLLESTLSPNTYHPKIMTLDNELIIAFRSYVLERISDTNLNVEDVSSEFGFSRAQFYRKMKAITNQGPNEFIRTIRLNRSVELLKTGKSVSEVAYDVGFTSPSYFAKCFKELFHVNPSEM